ncbi:uncharacterized protein LOC128743129 isoform X2 [Sabethes cyaneus]|uniref:uncharacterized protein LOC128743129 isoform X2 n=1 Tax=Sabethes cyaneus TaxID=53552 RepID=UPI00237E2917|nr:uncharacterized protein LOC128743129 isoform X2 [Sabethes cyaneus]
MNESAEMETAKSEGSAACNSAPDTAEQPNTVVNSELEGYEPVPDDLSDFIVIDQVGMTDDDECSDGSDGGENDSAPKEAWKDFDSQQWACPAHQLQPSGTKLPPARRDNRCKADWPLGTFWPVYVGNFRLFHKRDGDHNCWDAVQKYFASKGIPCFMVFRLKDQFYEEYQKVVGLYDMLVYFCCLKNAKLAVQLCNKELYYGYRLKVYSGREPNLFSNEKAWYFKAKKTEHKFETEDKMEQYLSGFNTVTGISKQDLDGVYVQFRVKIPLREDIITDQFDGFPVTQRVQKQRYIEKDVEQHILEEIARNPKFMIRRPRAVILKSLSNGIVPDLKNNWMWPEFSGHSKFQAAQKLHAVRLRNHIRQIDAVQAFESLKGRKKYPNRKMKMIAAITDERKQLKAIRRMMPAKRSHVPNFLYADDDPPLPNMDHVLMNGTSAALTGHGQRQRVPPKRRRMRAGANPDDWYQVIEEFVNQSLGAEASSFMAGSVRPEGVPNRQNRQRVRSRQRKFSKLAGVPQGTYYAPDFN